MADSLYQILEGLQVSREEIVEGETFVKQYLRANFPDLDLREGVALYDLVIRPSSTLAALLNKGLKFYFDNNTISGVTDETPEDIVDKTMSNLFLTRNAGNSSIVRARLYFIDSNRDVFIPTSSSFSVDNETFFRPIVDTRIRSGLVTDDVPGDFSYDASREEYYYDMDLISSSQDESANVEAGEFIYFSNIDPYYVGSSILYLTQRAIPKESNTQFISRASTAISTRNLINDPSIDSIVRANFNYVSNLVTSGYGDVEMKRDFIRVFNPETLSQQELHLGGKVDVYIDAPTAPQEPPEVKQFLIPENGIIDIPADQGNSSYIIYDIRRATPVEIAEAGINDASDVNPLSPILVKYGQGQFDSLTNTDNFREIGDYDSNNQLIDVGFSNRQTTRIIVNDPLVQFGGYTITLRYWRFTGVLGIQRFFDDTSNKVVCADYLARSLNNYAIDVNVLRIGNIPLSDSQVASVRTTLKNFFSEIKAGETIIVSNLVKDVVTNSGISDIDVNVQVSYTYFNRNFVLESGIISSHKECDRTDIFVLRNVTSNPA